MSPPRRPFHVGCELTGLGICYCLGGTPESFRDANTAEDYCNKAEDVTRAWKKRLAPEDQPEETQILLPVLYKRNDLSDRMVEIEGLKVAEEEEKSSRETAELLANKAAHKANLLGLSNTLLSEMDDTKLEVVSEESVDHKLDVIQKTMEDVRQEMREMEKRRDDLFSIQEQEFRCIGQRMEATMESLETIKNKLPPDRLQEAMVVKEAAHGIFSKSRKSSRKHRRLLKKEDITKALIGSWLSVYWPDDNQWWNVLVQTVNPNLSTATLLYETEEAEEIDLKQLVEKGELAWLEMGGSGGGGGGGGVGVSGSSEHARKKKRHQN